MQDARILQSPEVLRLRSMWLAHGVPFVFEQSAQFHTGQLVSDRGLFSIPIAALGADAPEQTVSLCQQWGAPSLVTDGVARYFPCAAHVHFGIELADGMRTAKCYLEPPAFGDATPDDDRSPIRFLGFKWSDRPASTPVLSRYTEVAHATWSTAESAVERVLSAAFRPAVQQLLTATRAGATDSAGINLLQVSDEGSERLSYDVNCYHQSLSIQSLAAEIAAVSDSFQIPAALRDAWLHRLTDHCLGHIAFGRDRQQRDFVTLYHRQP